MVVMLLVLMWIVYRIARHASMDKENKFDFAEAFLDTNGKSSMARICVFAALVVSTWTLIALVVTDALSEWFYTAYLGAFVLNGIGSKFAEKKE